MRIVVDEENKSKFHIEQGPEWELVQGGVFSTAEDAISAMSELESTLGWLGMRVTERDDDGALLDVVAVGTESAAEFE